MSVEYSSLLDLSRRFQVAAAIAPGIMEKFLEEDIAKPIVEEMREDAPVASGQLRDSLRYIKTEPLKISIGAFGVYYVKFVIEGTKPHTIKPKDKQALKFSVNGRTVFATVVKHPGTRANPFMTDASERVLKRALPKIAGVLMEGFREQK